MSIEKTLSGREELYGRFEDQAAKSQALKGVMHSCQEWQHLDAQQKESLDMIVHKIARILNGKGNNYADNWHDIAGYATLVEQNLE